MEIQPAPGVPLITLRNISVNTGGNAILTAINLDIQQGEQWAVIGHSGSGKTTLAHVLQGKIFYRGELVIDFPEHSTARIELVAQQHHFKNLQHTSSFYYQQRFNASESENSVTVADALQDYADKDHWIALLHLLPLLQKPLLQLSNGENKRLQLAKALLARPAILILDNPFLGWMWKGEKHCMRYWMLFVQKGSTSYSLPAPQNCRPALPMWQYWKTGNWYRRKKNRITCNGRLQKSRTKKQIHYCCSNCISRWKMSLQ